MLLRLDKALIRPGRVDLKEMIGFASEYQLIEMFRRFYPEQPESRAKDFSASVVSLEYQVSAAQIQGFFMLHKHDPDYVLANVKDIVRL